MKITKLPRLSVLVSLLALCSAGVSPAHIRPLPSVLHLPAAAVEIPIGDLGETECLFLITTYEQYEQLFGEGATGVNFKTEWAFFYSAGLQPTGGYEALVADIAYTPEVQSLVITTQLLSPGMNCAVPQHITKPNLLVRFPKPPGEVGMVRLDKDDQVIDCGGGNGLKSASPLPVPK
jgi:hypothetical protein